MIIKYPTGSYNKILPTGNEAGNVTFTISNQNPPRSSFLFNKAPISIYANKPVYSYVEQDRQLIYSSIKSNPSDALSNKKQYNIGEILDFTTYDVVTVDQQPQSAIDTQHNINKFDYKSMGLDDTEINRIIETSKKQYNDLSQLINNQRQDKYNIDYNIQEKQKILNELNKTAASMKLLNGLDDIIAKLNVKISDITLEINGLIINSNTLSEEIKQNTDTLRELSMVVK